MNQEIKDIALKTTAELIRRHGIEKARKIAKIMLREVQLPMAEEMQGILLVMQAEEMTTPFGW